MCGDKHTNTAQGRMQKPELDTICTWIKEAWEELDPKIIVRAFKKCCISNALDGSEDDILWEETPSTSTEDSHTKEDCDRNDIVYDDETSTGCSVKVTTRSLKDFKGYLQCRSFFDIMEIYVKKHHPENFTAIA